MDRWRNKRERDLALVYNAFCLKHRGHTTGVSRAAAAVRVAAVHERGHVHRRLEPLPVRLLFHRLQRAHLRQRCVRINQYCTCL